MPSPRASLMFTGAEFDELTKELQRRDRRGKGALTHDEVQGVFASLGYTHVFNKCVREMLPVRERAGGVNYEELLDQIESEGARCLRRRLDKELRRLKGLDETVGQVHETLLHAVEEAADGLGKLSRWQFRGVLEDINVQFSEEELTCLMDYLDKDGDKKIPVKGFLEFSGIDVNVIKQSSEALHQIRRELQGYSKSDLVNHFQQFDRRGKGRLSADVFEEALDDLQVQLHQRLLDALRVKWDDEGCGVAYSEFVHAVASGEAARDELEEGEDWSLVEGSGAGMEKSIIVNSLRRLIRESMLSHQQFTALVREESVAAARDVLRVEVQRIEGEGEMSLLEMLQEDASDLNDGGTVTRAELRNILEDFGLEMLDHDISVSVEYLCTLAGEAREEGRVPVDAFAAFAGAAGANEAYLFSECMARLRRDLGAMGRRAFVHHMERFDGRNRGSLSVYAFQDSLEALDVALSPEEMSALSGRLERRGKGLIYYDALAEELFTGAPVQIPLGAEGEDLAGLVNDMRHLINEARHVGLNLDRIFKQSRFEEVHDVLDMTWNAEQLRALRANLRACDSQGGKLRRSDVRHSFEQLGHGEFWRSTLQHCTSRFDLTGEGYVDMNSLMDFLEHESTRFIKSIIAEQLKLLECGPAASTTAEVMRSFKLCDRDCRETVSRWRFQGILEDAGIYMTEEQMTCLLDYLDPEDFGEINYQKFFAFLGGAAAEDERWSFEDVLLSLRNALGAYSQRRLESHFALFDRHGRNCLSWQTFEDALVDLGVHLSLPESRALLEGLGVGSANDRRVKVDYIRFTTLLMEGTEAEETLASLKKLIRRAGGRGIDLMEAFEHFDRHRSGEIREGEFQEGLRQLGMPLSGADAYRLMKEFEGTKPGRIRYEDFVRMIRQGQRVSGRRASQQDRLDMLAARLRSHVEICSRKGMKLEQEVQEAFNNTYSASMSPARFRSALQDLNFALSREELGVLLEHFVDDNTGTVNRQRFLDIFGTEEGRGRRMSGSRSSSRRMSGSKVVDDDTIGAGRRPSRSSPQAGAVKPRSTIGWNQDRVSPQSSRRASLGYEVGG
ncbi:unnamed protein product [Chrysoparadoxa australica]